jgi:hypothetical protein
MRLRLLATSFMTAAIFSAIASAQARGVGGFAHPPAVTPGFAGFGVTTTGLGPAFSRRPVGGPPVVFFSDFGYEPVTTQPVSVVIVQPPYPAIAPHEDQPRPPAKPLLLERQGDRWVQVEQFQMTRNLVTQNSKTVRMIQNVPTDTVLVFRDGHSEATSAYAVIGDALYEQSNYWTSGRWNKKIPIADLDLPATIQANQQRGIVFKLPGGPNEVVVQP